MDAFMNNNSELHQEKEMTSNFSIILSDRNLKSDICFEDFIVLEVKQVWFTRTTWIVQAWRFLECSNVPREAMVKGAYICNT